ncbi:unnamed protein product, partial [marine sediment metagenome]
AEMKKINCAIIGQGGAGGINYPQRRRDGLIKAVGVGYGILMHKFFIRKRGIAVRTNIITILSEDKIAVL